MIETGRRGRGSKWGVGALLCLAACDPGSPPIGAGAAGAGTSVSLSASSDSTGDASAGPTTAAANGGVGGSAPACTSLTDIQAPAPTPGRCDAGHAITCSPTGTVLDHACNPDETCREYDVTEYVGGSTETAWVKGRVVVWAACVAASLGECSFTFGESLQFQPSVLPHCEEQGKARCVMSPRPPDDDAHAAVYVTADGSVVVEPCAATDVCVPGCSPNALACVAADAQTCTGEGLACDGARITRCCGGHPIPETDCSQTGDTCVHTLMGGAQGLGQCFYTDSAACASPAESCDPATNADTCQGTVARRCRGVWKETDCSLTGRVCAVALGVAGCKAPNAPTCVSPYASCVGDEVVDCCSACGNSGGVIGSYSDCVPGFETRFDCTAYGYTCDDQFIATCN